MEDENKIVIEEDKEKAPEEEKKNKIAPLGVYPKGHEPQNLGGKEPVKDEEVKKENRQLLTLFLVIGGILILFGATYFFVSSMNEFTYRGTEFKTVKEGSLIFYHTAFPLQDHDTGKIIGNYNFYIRNDPRKLGEDVGFDGDITLMNNIVLNSTNDFNCDGDGVIAIANFQSLLQRSGATVIKDENATCDEQGRYSYILLQEGEVTGIEKVGASCYNININNCEILKGTERFMIEIFAKINEKK